MRILVNLIVIGVLAGLLQACSGGGDSASVDNKQAAAGNGGGTLTRAPVANSAPVVNITSPQAGAQSASNQLLVSGTAADADGVSTIVVNGQHASSTDGFANWTAQIPLREGVNSITVSATDSLGNSNSRAATLAVERGYLFDKAQSTVMDVARKRAILIAENGATLMTVDSGEQTRREFSGPNIGTGPRLVRPEKLFLDSANDRIVLFDSGRAAVLAVDLQTGNRNVLASNEKGSGPLLNSTLVVATNPNYASLYALTDSQLLTVNLSSGNRNAVNLNGPNIGEPRSARLDVVNNRLLVSAASNIYAVNLATGLRSALIASNSANN